MFTPIVIAQVHIKKNIQQTIEGIKTNAPGRQDNVLVEYQ